MTDLASAAFRLALRHVAVFPLAPGTKVPPTGSHGHLGAADDADVTRVRWQQTPRANIGAATGRRSGFWVLDIDLQHDGPAALARLEAEHGALPITIGSTTPSGGRHLYWRWPAGGPELRNSCARVGPGLDVRGEGGSIVVPPSILANGRCYRWVKNGARTFADAPGWLIGLALPPPPPPRPDPVEPPENVEKYVAAAVASEFRRLEEAASGQRNESLNRAAFAVGQFVAIGAVPEDWAAAELERRAHALGLPAFEARRTITSGIAAGRRHPRELPR